MQRHNVANLKHLTVLCINLFVLASCSPTFPAASSASQVTPDGPSAPITKSKDGLNVTLSYAPSPLKVGVPTQLTLTVTDEQNRLVNDAAITMDLEMLGMTMAKNQPKVEAVGNGVYKATGTFTMGGNTWAVTLHITRGNQTTEILFSSLDVKE